LALASPVRRAFASEPATPASGRLAFDITRYHNHIGECALRFESSGDDLLVFTTVSIVIAFGPITLYRFGYRGTERWRDGQFIGLDSETTHNGETLTVAARRVDQGIEINATGQPRQIAPAEALPLTHWNNRNMSVPLFNPQDGKLMHDRVIARGEETVSLGDGQQVKAQRFSLVGGVMKTDDWYDPSEVWTAMRIVATDGSLIDYRRTV
jgi:hypothetical protein